MMGESSCINKICSYICRLGSTVPVVFSVAIDKSTCGCDKPSSMKAMLMAENRQASRFGAAWPPDESGEGGGNSEKLSREDRCMEMTKRRRKVRERHCRGNGDGVSGSRVRWRSRIPPGFFAGRPLVSLMALLSLCSWLGLAAASDGGQQKENSKS
jgi:hypothetical protein